MRHHKQRFLSGCCLAALAFVMEPAFAQVTTSASLSVSMVVNADCEISNIGALAFATPQPDATSAEQAASFELRCTANTPFSLGIDSGTAGAASRMLTGAASGKKVPYELFKDAALTEPWGNDDTTRLTSSGTGASQAFSVYGRVADLSTAVPDSYSDSVTLSVSY